MTETKLANAVGPTWDACIRIIPMGEEVRRVVFSLSGALIAARGDSCMKVFDAMTGVHRATFDVDMFISSVTFSPDDGFLSVSRYGGTMNVWDVQTGTMFRTFKGSSATLSVAFSSCGTMIASGNADWTVQIWNISSGGCDCVLKGHSAPVMDVCWLATWNQVASVSYDHTVRIWDTRKQTCSKIFAQYQAPMTALRVAFSRGLLLVTSTNNTVKIYDPQADSIIYVIRSNNITHSRFSIDGGKVLVASRNSGDIWDMTMNTLTRVQSIDYNGEQAMFSPDGTRIASIYGKFLKIWKTNAGHNHHGASTHVHDPINDIYISPDEQLVTLKSRMGAEILDAVTGQSLFTYPVADVLSIAFSLDSAFVAFLSPYGTVKKAETWNTHTRLPKSIAVDDDVFHIALSPDGRQLASLSSSHMKLWDLESEGCIAHLQFGSPLQAQLKAQISFSTNTTNVCILKNSNGAQSWRISPNANIDLTENPIKNGDGTKSWLIARPLTHRWRISPYSYTNSIKDPIKNREGTKLPMVFVLTTEERSNQDASAPCQSYRCDTDGEWILDQDGRCVLWIPPDERPRKIWGGFKREKKVFVQTESGKVYIVNFSQS
jgi:WD40 repeat protein